MTKHELLIMLAQGEFDYLTCYELRKKYPDLIKELAEENLLKAMIDGAREVK